MSLIFQLNYDNKNICWLSYFLKIASYLQVYMLQKLILRLKLYELWLTSLLYGFKTTKIILGLALKNNFHSYILHLKHTFYWIVKSFFSFTCALYFAIRKRLCCQIETGLEHRPYFFSSTSGTTCSGSSKLYVYVNLCICMWLLLATEECTFTAKYMH